MKKFFATAVMAMSMGCVFAQGNVNTNDSTANDSTQTKLEAMLLAVVNDSVTNDSTKALAMLEDSVTNDSTKALAMLEDSVVNDSTKALAMLEDSVVNDSTKALAMLEDSVVNDSTKALIAQNDTVVTDSTKAQPAALVAYTEVNDTVTTEKKDAEKSTQGTCDKKAGEKAIQAFNAMRKITA